MFLRFAENIILILVFFVVEDKTIINKLISSTSSISGNTKTNDYSVVCRVSVSFCLKYLPMSTEESNRRGA